EGRGGELPVERLAYHYARGGDEEKAVAYLEEAGDRAASQVALGAARDYYREVVDRLEALGRTREAVHAREKLGRVLWTAGRYDTALEVLEQAVESWRAAGDLEGVARVTVQIGWARSFSATTDEGIACIEPLLEPLARNGLSRHLAELYIVLNM